MSGILNYDRKRPELIELAVLDESADYEVDITEIHYDPSTKELLLLTASGCSCWDGEYGEERFKSMKALYNSLLKDDRTYNPTYKGAEALIALAKTNLKAYKKGEKVVSTDVSF